MAKDTVRYFFLGMPIGLYLLLIAALALLVAGFIVPPLGVIDPSLLTGIAEMLGFTWLLFTTANIPEYIERGAKISASYGGATISVGKHRKERIPTEEIIEEETEENDTEEFNQ